MILPGDLDRGHLKSACAAPWFFGLSGHASLALAAGLYGQRALAGYTPAALGAARGRDPLRSRAIADGRHDLTADLLCAFWQIRPGW